MTTLTLMLEVCRVVFGGKVHDIWRCIHKAICGGERA